MGGADFDGDFLKLTSLLTDKFNQRDYIIFNPSKKTEAQKEILTDEKAKEHIIRMVSVKNKLGETVNLNTSELEILNSEKTLERFAKLRKHFDLQTGIRYLSNTAAQALKENIALLRLPVSKYYRRNARFAIKTKRRAFSVGVRVV